MTKEFLKLTALVFWCGLAAIACRCFEVYYLEPNHFHFNAPSVYGSAGLGLPFVFGLWQTMSFIDQRFY